MKIRFTRVVAVDLQKHGDEEIVPKTFYRWDIIHALATMNKGKDKTDIALENGDIIYDVPTNAFEILP
jgi:hypothetical protein